MTTRVRRAAGMLLGSVLLTVAAAAADDRPGEQPSANDLSLEVAALETLYFLQPTPDQEKVLRELASKTASDAGPRAPGKAGAKLRAALSALRRALIEEDDERIEELGQELAELRDQQKPDLDDRVDVTEAGLEEAPRLLRVLSPRQVAGFAASYADELPDPLEEILAALDKVRGLNDDEWRDFRAGMPEHLGTLLGGTDADRAAGYRDKIMQLLIWSRGLGDDDYKARKPDMEKRARTLVGDVGPLEVIRHHLEYQLAELLSNPRLTAALDARARALKTRAATK